jgi:hypothetical protein
MPIGRETWAVAFGLNARGATGIILAGVGLANGVIDAPMAARRDAVDDRPHLRLNSYSRRRLCLDPCPFPGTGRERRR